MNKRYQIIIVYDDYGTKTEHTDNIISALEAIAIYLRDSTCIIAKVWDENEKEWIVNYWR